MIFAQMGTDLIKLLPDGANVIAVIVVVVLFLKQQEKFNVILKSITDDFHTQIKENQRAFQEQIGQLSQQYFANQQLYQKQIQALMDAHITVTREVITTLQEVKTNVSAINQKMVRYEEQDDRRREIAQPPSPLKRGTKEPT
jgi:hypothetical protein